MAFWGLFLVVWMVSIFCCCWIWLHWFHDRLVMVSIRRLSRFPDDIAIKLPIKLLKIYTVLSQIFLLSKDCENSPHTMVTFLLQKNTAEILIVYSWHIVFVYPKKCFGELQNMLVVFLFFVFFYDKDKNESGWCADPLHLYHYHPSALGWRLSGDASLSASCCQQASLLHPLSFENQFFLTFSHLRTVLCILFVY